MADKINLPYFGETDLAVIAAIGGGTLVVIGVIWWRAHQQKQQKNKKQQVPIEVFIAGQTGEDPAGNKGVIDPETGYVYDSPEDLERLGELAIENYASAIYYPPQLVPDVRREHGGEDEDRDKDDRRKTGRGHRQNNETWVNDAVNDLAGNFDQDTLRLALLKVLACEPVTTKEKAMFLEAKALEGDPPGGYCKPIRLLDSDAHPKAKFEPTDLPGMGPDNPERPPNPKEPLGSSMNAVTWGSDYG